MKPGALEFKKGEINSRIRKERTLMLKNNNDNVRDSDR